MLSESSIAALHNKQKKGEKLVVTSRFSQEEKIKSNTRTK